MKKYILFVCTGNTCRSPMAMEFFNSLSEKGDYVAISAGLYTGGAPISQNAKAVLEENGIKSNHTSVQISAALMEQSDYVFGITKSHAVQLISMFPQFADKIYSLPSDISDPFGGDINTYRTCFSQIKQNVGAVIKYLNDNEQ